MCTSLIVALNRTFLTFVYHSARSAHESSRRHLGIISKCITNSHKLISSRPIAYSRSTNRYLGSTHHLIWTGYISLTIFHVFIDRISRCLLCVIVAPLLYARFFQIANILHLITKHLVIDILHPFFSFSLVTPLPNTHQINIHLQVFIVCAWIYLFIRSGAIHHAPD